MSAAPLAGGATGRNEKAAGMLDTSTTASKSQCTGSLPAAEKNGKDFAKLQAQFALLGRDLTRCCRAHDGHTTVSYTVTRFGEPRYFSQLHDVSAHLLQIGRRP